jgi:hypothetical protein
MVSRGTPKVSHSFHFLHRASIDLNELAIQSLRLYRGLKYRSWCSSRSPSLTTEVALSKTIGCSWLWGRSTYPEVGTPLPLCMTDSNGTPISRASVLTEMGPLPVVSSTRFITFHIIPIVSSQVLLVLPRNTHPAACLDYLALGLIVLIAIAISTGLIFLLVLIGLLCLYWYRRHRKTEAPAPVVTTLMEKRPSSEFGDTDSIRLRRLGAIQEAVFGSAAVAATSFAAANKTASPRDMTDDTRSSFGYDSTSQGHTTNQEHFPGQYAAAQRYAANQTSDSHNESTSPSHMGRPTTVKYTFMAEDPAELSVHEGDYVNVLEEAEDEQWWYVRDSQGREGVVPASYLW